MGPRSTPGNLDAADITAEVLELIDGDGVLPVDAPGGAFAGTPACDSNQDGSIGAADITCTVLLLIGRTCGDSLSLAIGYSEAQHLEDVKRFDRATAAMIGLGGRGGFDVDLTRSPITMAASSKSKTPVVSSQRSRETGRVNVIIP